MNPERQSAGDSFGRVFIEGADVVSDEIQMPLQAWLAKHPVEVHHTQAMLVSHDTPTSVAWNRCANRNCSATELWNFTVTPSLPKRASDPLNLTIALQPASDTPDEPWSFTVQTRDQHPVRIDFPGSATTDATSMVLTPFLVNGDEDLRAIMICKKNLAASERRTRAGDEGHLTSTKPSPTAEEKP